MKIALVEPYFGGSHRSFWRTLEETLPYEFQFHTLPARKWKWRMRLAAPFFAEQFCREPEKLDGVRLILCSPFLDVAAFKGLLPTSLIHIPVFIYYHENQFAYPVQVDDKRDFHFALTNLTSALASDRIAFNSQYNFQSFLKGSEELLKKIYDMNLQEWKKSILEKSIVLYPGLDFSELDKIDVTKKGGDPVIVWNHRWEHDKNPDLFFQTLARLENDGRTFKIIVLGESFQRVPEIFIEAKERFKHISLQFGFVKSRHAYLSYLKQGDIVVSTANHEFYGISVIEAVRAGCRPLLPAALSYPELFPDKFLYKEGELYGKITQLLQHNDFSGKVGKELTDPYSWASLLPHYKKWLTDDCM